MAEAIPDSLAADQCSSQYDSTAAQFNEPGSFWANSDGWNVSLYCNGGKPVETCTSSELLTLIKEETGKEVSIDMKIEKMGLDSLDFLALVIEIQNKFKVLIADSMFPQIHTVGDLLEAVNAHVPN